MMKEINSVILLVEDRISEVLESGDLKTESTAEGLITEKYMKAAKKMRFLVALSRFLADFEAGNY